MIHKKCKTIILFLTILLMLFTGCEAKNDASLLVSWVDSDGTLIEYSQIPSSEDPTQKNLPEDNDYWHYIGWEKSVSGDTIICKAVREKKLKLVWQNADGSIIDTQYKISSESNSSLCELPADTEKWHYTEWKETISADGYLYIPQRLPKTKYVWMDSEGNILKEDVLVEGDTIPNIDLPINEEKWIYTDWSIEKLNDSVTYTAQRIPNNDYFIGNVFQIIIKDENGDPLGAGSGFVLNAEGWFITNNHVMEGATSAVAFFDIKDKSAGSQYTQLNVLGGIYNSEEKDIFIGKLSGYEKIKNYYNPIIFTENYSKGDVAYTIGYPNSSVKLEINSGEILEEYSDIYDKINGVFYILSDSYIAPGSSGGILTNEKFEVIGITTIGLYADVNKQVYQAGGSVPTFVFASHLKNLEDAKLKTLNEIYKNNILEE